MRKDVNKGISLLAANGMLISLRTKSSSGLWIQDSALSIRLGFVA